MTNRYIIFPYITINLALKCFRKERYSLEMKNQISESKLWKAITAVASGIMTSLLYDLVSQTSYILRPEGMQYVLIADDNNVKNTTFAVISILLLFFCLWGVFTIIIQTASKFSKQLSFKKMEHISGNALVNAIDRAKEQTIYLKSSFNNESFGISDSTLAKLQLRNLAVIITALHVKFVPHNLYRKNHMKYNFRQPDHSTIINISNSISKYEFLSLIELLYDLVNSASLHTNGDKLMIKDCNEILTMLNELKKVVDSVE